MATPPKRPRLHVDAVVIRQLPVSQAISLFSLAHSQVVFIERCSQSDSFDFRHFLPRLESLVSHQMVGHLVFCDDLRPSVRLVISVLIFATL